MNFMRSKLNKTTAVPSIYIKDQKEIDLLVTATDWVVENRMKEIPPSFQNSSQDKIKLIDIDEELCTPVAKKIKMEAPKSQEIRILNKLSSTHPKVLTIKHIKNDKISNVRKSLPNVLATTEKIQKTPIKIETKPIYQMQTSEDNSAVSSKQLLNNSSTDDYQDTFEVVRFIPTNLKNNDELLKTPDFPEEIKSMLLKTSQDVADIKSLVKENITKSQIPPQNCEISNITQSQLNKVQLFNGIKRYLSPSLTALLRLELFATTNREYKRDEKIICSELLKLGNETYDFMAEEWRLRLPSKDQVMEWTNEDATDDDAS